MKQYISLVFILFFISCGESEISRFNKRISVVETLSKTSALSNQILTAYIDSVSILKAEVSVSDIEMTEKTSLDEKLSSIYNDLRSSRAYNCIRYSTITSGNTSSDFSFTETQVTLTSKNSARIEHKSASFFGRNRSQDSSHETEISWIPYDEKVVVLTIPVDENNNHNGEINLVAINDLECHYEVVKNWR